MLLILQCCFGLSGYSGYRFGVKIFLFDVFCVLRRFVCECWGFELLLGELCCFFVDVYSE